MSCLRCRPEAVLALGLFAAACAAGPPASQAVPAELPDLPDTEEPTSDDAVPSRSPNRISRAEIMTRSGEHNAMGLIRRLRPAWLRSRGSNSFTSPGAMYPTVYVDNVRREGGLSALYQVPSTEIRMMEFIGPADATTRWGTGHSAGVIRIVTGR